MHHDIENTPGIESADIPDIKVINVIADEVDQAKATGNNRFTILTSLNPSSSVQITGGSYIMGISGFECVKKGNDSFFYPTNEIYWAISSANSLKQKVYGIKKVYQDVNDGYYTNFEPLIELYKGIVDSSSTLCIFIQCWEQDDSTAAQMAQIRKATEYLTLMLLDIALKASGAGSFTSAVVKLLLQDLGNWIGDLFNIFFGDDLVKERTLTIDHKAMESLWNKDYKSDYWNFDG